MSPRKPRADWFIWTVGDRAERLRRLYLDQGLGPEAVAARIGEGCTARHVTDGVRALGYRRPRRASKGCFDWTVEGREALLRRLYVGEGLSPEVIAWRIGRGCTPLKVRRAAHRLGLAAARGLAGHGTRGEGRVTRIKPRRPARRAQARVAGSGMARRRRAGPGWRRFVARFLDAGWPPGEVAWLFDLDPAVLGEGRGLS